MPWSNQAVEPGAGFLDWHNEGAGQIGAVSPYAENRGSLLEHGIGGGPRHDLSRGGLPETEQRSDGNPHQPALGLDVARAGHSQCVTAGVGYSRRSDFQVSGIGTTDAEVVRSAVPTWPARSKDGFHSLRLGGAVEPLARGGGLGQDDLHRRAGNGQIGDGLPLAQIGGTLDLDVRPG